MTDQPSHIMLTLHWAIFGAAKYPAFGGHFPGNPTTDFQKWPNEPGDLSEQNLSLSGKKYDFSFRLVLTAEVYYVQNGISCQPGTL